MTADQQTIELPESVARQSLGAAPASAFARVLFVWAKGGKIACLSPDEIRGREQDMQKSGWHHTATLDPARWIEAMANGQSNPSDMLNEIQFVTNINLHT